MHSDWAIAVSYPVIINRMQTYLQKLGLQSTRLGGAIAQPIFVITQRN
ncbi:MAG: hypothetical protein NW220_24020 [Leptolyngbyaceae cyanobacterium bins.349]|nr:hypothetical protein [Leptolyngbyaceae cyanobacterium bins.349]